MISLFKVNMSKDVGKNVEKVLESGMVGEGEVVEKFARELGDLWSFQNITCLNSCTSALILALRLAGVSQGKEVVSTPFTFPATNCAIKTVGGNVIWADIDKRTLCVDTNSILKQLRQNKNVKTIVLTLVTGLVPIGIENLLAECRRLQVKVIADCAHAFLTEYKGKHISHWFDYCCFSFQSIKHLTTVDGGALTCLDIEDHSRAEKLKWFGISREIPEGKTRLEHQMSSVVNEWGYKFHMNNVSASIGLSNLEAAVASVRISRENSYFYIDNLPKRILPIIEEGSNPSFWTFPLILGNNYNELTFCIKLEEKGIVASPMWMMNDRHPCFGKQRQQLIPNKVFIPNGFWVGNTERESILEAIKEILHVS